MKRDDFTMPEDFWEAVQHLLPAEEARIQGGRPRLDNYRALSGILYRLRTGCQWKAVPKEFGAGSTLQRRFQEWAQAGVFDDIYGILLRLYDDAKGIAWDWASLDASIVKAPKGGDATGPNPTDRAKSGTKRHVITDDRGVPLAVEVSAANKPDCHMVESTLHAVPAVSEKKIEQVENLCMDKAYDSKKVDDVVKAHGIEPHTRRRGEAPLVGVYAGKPRRWKVERCNSWHNRFRGLLVRWDRKACMYKASLCLASGLIAFQQIISTA